MRKTVCKDSRYTLPPDKRTQISAAAIAFHDKYLKAGQLKDVYAFPDGKLMSIWSVGSLEELVVIMMDHPHSGLVDSETVPFIGHQTIDRPFAEGTAAARKPARK